MTATAPPGPSLGGIADRARILEQGGHPEEAIEEYRRVLKEDDDPRIRAGLACALALAGRTAEARAEVAGLEALPATAAAPPYAIAGARATRGGGGGASGRLEQ